ncbi:hypothetical protein VTK26DRAFT_1096 [Humicola hyalothermophila]
MANVPKTVVIVGGSLAGLLHGLYLKRHGSNVVVLEQDPNPIRSSHQAGIAFGPAVEEILRKYDATGLQNCTPSVATRIAYRKRESFKEIKVIRHLTSWGLLYRILRANFDGLASDAVPNPPPPREGDGKAEYRAGHKVTNLGYEDGVVTVRFVGPDGTEGSLTADLLIGADGVHSTVRNLVQAPTISEYSGYVSWRGTVREKDLPPETAKYFEDKTSINILSDTYFVCYVIPDDSGSFTPGTRLVNWVWYYNLAESSPELAEVLTDVSGRRHGSTVPSSLVQPEVWRRHLAATLPRMAAPFAEMVSATERPFVTRVSDALCEAGASFCDGRVVLVGDALATFRPHFAVATEQAARHCLALGRVWAGQMTVRQWSSEVTAYGKRMWLASRVLGAFGTGRWLELARTLCAYVWLLVGLKLGKA